MQIERVSVDSLVFDPVNARKHSKRNLDAIKGSLAKFGQQKPLVVDANNVVIAGNGTLEAAKELGWKDIDIHRSPLKGAEAIAFALADNKTAELADWDEDILSEHLAALYKDGWDIEDIGFSVDDLDFDGGTEGNTDPDEVPEVEENKFGVSRGQIWQLGEHRVMCGDSTSSDDVAMLMDGQKADMVFTDPPYGVDYDGGMKKRRKLDNDHLKTGIYSQTLPLYVENTTDRAAFYIWYADGHIAAAAAAAAGLHISAQIIWVKNHAQFMSNARYKGKHEPCMYGYKNGKGADWFGPNNEVTVWECDRAAKNEFHPTQKPVELPSRAIENSSKKGAKIADWFSGSGSTLIACEKTGRKCYGMEIDPHYCSVIIERWQNFTGKEAKLLPGTKNS